MKKEKEVNTVNLTLKMYFDKSEGMLSPWNILEVGVWISTLTVLTDSGPGCWQIESWVDWTLNKSASAV